MYGRRIQLEALKGLQVCAALEFAQNVRCWRAEIPIWLLQISPTGSRRNGMARLLLGAAPPLHFGAAFPDRGSLSGWRLFSELQVYIAVNPNPQFPSRELSGEL
ncbi:hypothetical protein FA13DRAFT_498132 [Coprinellus micaceus]|uniref:Uncharacterized protein n=1 Tax=Coprinellus micaceus TaxID=71717 RepID=A0A4Y7TB55_COPMI|nr:hypothetical protein FA13DRAFT_498132 [Coprinellus micaceus]